MWHSLTPEMLESQIYFRAWIYIIHCKMMPQYTFQIPLITPAFYWTGSFVHFVLRSSLFFKRKGEKNCTCDYFEETMPIKKQKICEMPPNSLNGDLRLTWQTNHAQWKEEDGKDKNRHKPAAAGTAFLPWPPGSGLGGQLDTAVDLGDRRNLQGKDCSAEAENEGCCPSHTTEVSSSPWDPSGCPVEEQTKKSVY